MSRLDRHAQRRIAFVSPYPTGESLRGARAVAQLDDVILLGICERPPESAQAGVFHDVARVGDTHDAAQLIDAAQRLAAQHGDLERIVTVRETLLTPVALAGETLELPGLTVSTVRRALDKSLLKQTLQENGIATARDRVITNLAEAENFVAAIGLPVVLKPLGGSGALATWRISTNAELETALDLWQPSDENPLLLEQQLDGEELCLDTITIANQPQLFSICRYRTPILEALEDPQRLWSCVMPRDMSGPKYHDFVERGLAAIRCLQVGNAVTHMEGFLTDGGGVRFTDATLRPAGARIGPMLGFAYDIDPYHTWARVMVDGRFDGPGERKYAVGTVFLRGPGHGAVAGVDGIQDIPPQFAELVVDSRLPRVGSARSVTYTGDGYITVRHPDTAAVETALDTIAQSVVVRYTDPPDSRPAGAALREHWSQRLQQFTQRLYRPAWEDDPLAAGRNV